MKTLNRPRSNRGRKLNGKCNVIARDKFGSVRVKDTCTKDAEFVADLGHLGRLLFCREHAKMFREYYPGLAANVSPIKPSTILKKKC